MANEQQGKMEAGNASILLRIAEFLIRVGGALSSLLIILILGIVCYAVLQRYVLDKPLLWSDQFIGYLLVATIMLGAAEALRRGDHISIELLAERVDGKRRLFIRLLNNFAVIAFAAVLGWSTWNSIEFARAFGSYSVGYIEIETWIPQVPLLFGAGLLILAATVRLLRLLSEKQP